MRLPIVLLMAAAVMAGCSPKEKPVKYWLTTSDKKELLAAHEVNWDATVDTTGVRVDTATTFQTMEGFGYSLTGGSSQVINTLSPEKRTALLKELFTRDPGIGVSYLRISIGSSDLDDHVFTYDDVPAGTTDPSLEHFSLQEDEKNLIPLLKEILVIAPTIKIMGSPWSAPAWMKTNGNLKGGSLKPEWQAAYAQYLVKYVQGMALHGIPLDAITVQNEPENPKNNPSLVMTADEQALFVGEYLGPAFKKAGLKTKIIIFDHNADHPEYPIRILNDVVARDYIAGSAFHLYLGEVAALSEVHNFHPDKAIYFTEQWTSARGDFGGDLGWHVKNLIVGAPRNHAVTVLEWNLAADQHEGPHTDEGGCTECLGALTIGDSVRRNVSYYIIAHASRFVPPGSVRVASNESVGFPNVAYRTPVGERVLIGLNEGDQQEFVISEDARSFHVTLPAHSVATFKWR
ncbi:MAG TPA: glycoside hydrolase family 30 beta sandwich domain-containing protein [Cyclobacteriaceae bacterium]|nr:glycoside hydrolase family 30 beta sandwich domain-containing protein [Cyclobacteriaceae bacterium]